MTSKTEAVTMCSDEMIDWLETALSTRECNSAFFTAIKSALRVADISAQQLADKEADCVRLVHDKQDLMMKLAEKDALIERLEKALEFYADPDTYAATSLFCDRPCGDISLDFSDDHGGDYNRPMLGKRAREALAAIYQEKQS